MPKRTSEKQPESPLVRELRRKFIVSAMASVGLVIVGIIAFIDVSYYLRMQDQFDQQLDTLASYDGSLENWLEDSSEHHGPWMLDDDFDFGEAPSDDGNGPVFGAPPEGVGEEPPAKPDGDDSAEPPAKPSGERKGDRFTRTTDGLGMLSQLGALAEDGGMTVEMPFRMRYFSVTYSSTSATYTEINVSNIASVSETDASGYADTARSAGHTRAYLGTLRYLVHELDSSTTQYLFLDCTSELLSMRSLLIASVSIVVIALLLVFVLVLFFSRRVVAPVAESYARQRRFITDASHDLKTPLAVIGSDVDVIELTEGTSEWTDSIRHQVDRMTDLTNKLVMLSRMDEGTEQVHKADFDLEALAESVSLEFKPVAEAAGKRIVCEAEARLTAHADATLIDQALHLLIDNALKYSSDEATIRVHAGTRRGGWYVAVENPVDEIEAGPHDELFERFARADSSRSSSTGGHGIGLAVVKAIAESHGGHVSASAANDHSIEFRVEF